MNTPKELVIKPLSEELIKKCGSLFALYMIEHSGTEEQKKQVKAARMFEGIMTGKFKKEEGTFIEENQKLYDEIQALTEAINTLTKPL